jgi:hypothetical protein
MWPVLLHKFSMVMKRALFLLSVSLFMCTISLAQTSYTFHGRILNVNNEAISNASVAVDGVARAVSVGVDGRFSIVLATGKKYILTISCSGYESKETEVNTQSKADSDNDVIIVLAVKKQLGETAVVKTSLKKENTAGLLNFQKNNTAMSSGVSADFIRSTPDKNTGEIMKRVSGASVQDNKFVVVRGLSDRYNSALINGAQMPSSEPDKKAFSFDVIPSALIDNILVNKTAIPELTSEFAGGLVLVNTKDVPTKDILSVGLSFGFNTQSAFRDFVSNNRSAANWLGFDNNRQLPAAFPSRNGYAALGAELGGTAAQANATRLLNSNAFTQRSGTALPNMSYNLTYGIGRKLKNGGSFGLVAGITYRNSQLLYEVDRQINDFNGTVERKFLDRQNRFSSSSGVILNLAYTRKKTRIAFKNLLNQLFEDNYYLRTGNNNIDDLEVDFRSSFVNQRTLYSSQLEAEQQLTKSGIKLKLNGNFSYNNKSQPDLRTTSFARNTGTSNPFQLVQDESGRFFSNLKDFGYGGGGALTIPFTMGKEKQTLKAGGSTLIRIRDFNSRNFRYRQAGGPSSLLFLPYDQIFKENNISENGFILADETQNEDKYFGVSILNAGYVQLDNRIGEKLRLVWGARVENFQQFLTTRRSDLKRVIVNTEKWDVLPSLNATYNITNKHLLKAAVYQTVARPEFREIAPFSFFDFEQNYAVSGDTTLRRSSIFNADLRYEWYPKAGEGISFGVFYKKFKDPIELRALASGSVRRYQFQNANEAETFGAELEVRKSLNFISAAMENFSVFSNITVINSTVNFSGTSAGGVTQNFNRPLQGQSPYLINFGLQYADKEKRFNGSLLYNRVGQRLSLVGGKDQLIFDIYERPRNLLDFQVSTRILKKRGELKLTVSDIINNPYYFYENIDDKKAFSTGTDRLWNSYRPGTTFTIGFTYDFIK